MATAVAVATGVSVMLALDLLVVAAALPSITRELPHGDRALPWVALGYGIPFASLLLLGGAAGERFGRRRVLSISLVLFVAASAWCAAASSVEMLALGRIAQGTAAAGALPVAIAVVVDVVAARRRAAVLGVIEGITGLATAVGPLLGGVTASTIGWRWVFWANVPVGLVAAGVAWRWLPAGRPARQARLDVRGGLLAAVAIGLVVHTMAMSAAARGVAPPMLVTGALGALATVVLVRHFRSTPSPLVPMELFARGPLRSALLATAALFGSLYGAVLFTAQYYQVALALSPTQAGLRLLPWTVTLFLVAPAAGILAGRWGERPVLMVGLLLQAGGMTWFSFEIGDPAYLASVLPLVLAGVGASAAIPAVQSWVLGTADDRTLGITSGLNNTAQELGGALGVATLIVAFSWGGTADTVLKQESGLRLAFAAAAVLATIGLALTSLANIRRDTRRREGHDGGPVNDPLAHAHPRLPTEGAQ